MVVESGLSSAVVLTTPAGTAAPSPQRPGFVRGEGAVPRLGVFAVDALAAWRLTILVTRDAITDPIRSYVEDRAAEPDDEDIVVAIEWGPDVFRDRLRIPSGRRRRWEWLATLLACPWCVSVWVGFGVVAARRIVPRLWDPVARALALSMLASAGAVAVPHD